MICKGKYSDIDKILEITKSCALYLIDNQIRQWNEHYPNKEAFSDDVKRNELYILKIDSILVGCISISTFMDDFYKPLKWLTPNENNLYIHRLAIHPKHQGKGYAQQLMAFAENYAQENHFSSIRLDTFSQNLRNLNFYERRGYQRLEGIYFPKQSVHPFYCYELLL
ncbi:GNAT family N-acetyltransferase [Mariniflexile sp.]|uniref:GNAT family N-acetyltransferase n=1 Tax=Mariniflexile sp. TaxID=1979402 RepID=UPI004047AF0E